MSRNLSTDIYSPDGELSFIIPAKDGISDRHPETGIQYLSQLQNKFEPCIYRQHFVDSALIGA